MSTNKPAKTNRELQKEKTFQEILEKGRELFIEKSSEGFSLRELAKSLNMAPSNIYNYVDNKRELWFAMLNEDYYSDFIQLLESLKAGNNNLKFIIQEIFSFLSTLAIENRPKYNLMFDTPAPPLLENQKPGHFELSFSPISINLINEIISKKIEQGDLTNIDPQLLTLYLWGFISGILKVGHLYQEISSGIDLTQIYSDFIKEFFKHHQFYFDR